MILEGRHILIVGSGLSNFLPLETSKLWPFIEDVFASSRRQELGPSILEESVAHEEFVLSIPSPPTWRFPNLRRSMILCSCSVMMVITSKHQIRRNIE